MPAAPRCATTLALLLFTATPGHAGTVQTALDLALAQLVPDTGTPGAAATVTRHGQTLWTGASGSADPAAGTPFTADTLASIASVTKPAVATMVRRLAEDGLIALDAPIAPHVPATVPGVDRVTIRQLVNMTAGCADVEGLPEFQQALLDPDHPWTRDEPFALIEVPQFKPGTQPDCSNTDYLLLGQIIDDVYPGGTPAAFRDLIAVPAGLGKDMVADRDPGVADRVADGHHTSGGVTVNVNEGATDLGVNTSVWGPLWADGGIGATAG